MVVGATVVVLTAPVVVVVGGGGAVIVVTTGNVVVVLVGSVAVPAQPTTRTAMRSAEARMVRTYPAGLTSRELRCQEVVPLKVVAETSRSSNAGTRRHGEYPRPVFQVLVDVLVPVFAVVAVGYLLARTVKIEPPALATIAYWVLGPIFIFDVLATAELDPSVVGKVVGSTVATMAVIGALAAVTMKVAGIGFSKLAATVLTSIHGNVGNFGLAICAFAFGAEVLPIAGIVMVTTNTVGIITGVGLATSRHQSILKAMLTGIASPLAIAVLPALVVNVTNTTLPLWLDRPVSLLAAALIPVMLLTLGVQIAGMPRRLPSPLITVPIGMKLIAAPVVAVLAVGLFQLTGMASSVVVLQAAMPAAVFTSLIALEHDLEPDYVTSVVLIGTLVSVITLPVVIALL